MVEHRGYRIELTAIGDLRGRRHLPLHLADDLPAADEPGPRLILSVTRIRIGNGPRPGRRTLPSVVLALVGRTGAQSFRCVSSPHWL